MLFVRSVNSSFTGGFHFVIHPIHVLLLMGVVLLLSISLFALCRYSIYLARVLMA